MSCSLGCIIFEKVEVRRAGHLAAMLNDPSGEGFGKEWDRFKQGMFGPPTGDFCDWLRERLAEKGRSLENMRRKGWDNPANDPGGKEWKQGGRSGVTKAGGHYTGKYLPVLESYNRIKNFIDKMCGGGGSSPTECPESMPVGEYEPDWRPAARRVLVVVTAAVVIAGIVYLTGGTGTGAAVSVGLRVLTYASAGL